MNILVSSNGADFNLNVNGNATSDFNKDISNIEYNDLNLPKSAPKTATPCYPLSTGRWINIKITRHNL